MSETSNAMVPRVPGTELIEQREAPNLVVRWSQTVATTASSIDPKTEQGLRHTVACLAKADYLLRDAINTKIEIRDWFLHVVKRCDEKTGEEWDDLRLVLVQPNGTTIATSSSSVMATWRHITEHYGHATLNPPVWIKVRSGQGQGANRFLEICEFGRDQPEPQKPTKSK